MSYKHFLGVPQNKAQTRMNKLPHSAEAHFCTTSTGYFEANLVLGSKPTLPLLLGPIVVPYTNKVNPHYNEALRTEN